MHMKKKTNVIDNIIWVLRSIFRFEKPKDAFGACGNLYWN